MPPAQALNRRQLNAVAFGRNGELGDLAVFNFGHIGRSSRRDFIQPVKAVHDPNMLDAEPDKGFGHKMPPIIIIHAD